MSKQYKLLKDMPGAKAGTIFKYCDATRKYLCPLRPVAPIADGVVLAIPKWVVEQYDDWFEFVPERVMVRVNLNKMYDVFVDGENWSSCTTLTGFELNRLLHNRK